MKISAIIAAFRESLASSLPDATVEDSKTVTAALERVSAASSLLITITPGPRKPVQLPGALGQYHRVRCQELPVVRNQPYLGAAAADIQADRCALGHYQPNR
jgi:hypothetical protein